MKYLFTTLLMISLSLTAFAQKTPTLKANETVSKSEAIAAQQLKITLNEEKCRYDHMAIQNGDNGTYGLKIAFARPCNNENSVTVNFRELGDAIMVKDLILKTSEYEFFNLFTEKDGTSGFEIVYAR